MRKATTSPWLYNYVKQRGDSMNVTIRMTVHGWWSAYRAPSGLMGKPEKQEDFVMFLVQDVIFYIDKAVLENYIKDDNKFLINIEGYGRHWFEIEGSETTIINC